MAIALLLERCLALFFVAMTGIKLLQLCLTLAFIKNDKERGMLSYKPSLKVAMAITNWISQEKGKKSLEKIPRAEYRVISDAMLRNYNQVVAKKDHKTFTSTEAARQSFFHEFSNTFDSTTWYLVNSTEYWGKSMMALPLGLSWFGCYIGWFVSISSSFVRERFWNQRSTEAWVILNAIGFTITDLYIVCCKEHLTWQEGLFKYKWINMFDKQQTHPLVGTNICPMYKREVHFRKDIMDFEYEVQEWDNSMVRLVPQSFATRKTPKWLSSANITVLVGATLLQMFGGLTPRLILATASFYVVRSAVDMAVGTEWFNAWYL